MAKCIRCDAEAPASRAVARGAERRWRLCDPCRKEWSKLAEVGRSDEPTRFEKDESLKFLFRVADSLGVDPFDALVREILRRQTLGGQLSDTEEDLIARASFAIVSGGHYSYTPGVKPKISKTLERVDRAERKKRSELNLPPPPGPGEAAKQRQVKYRLKAKKKTQA